MAAFAAKRSGWQVKKLDSAPAGLSARGGATICSTSVGLIIFGGANREQVAFDDIALCPKPIIQPKPTEESSEESTPDASEAAEGEGAEAAEADAAVSEGASKTVSGTKLGWKKIVTEGDVPQPRSGHATVSYGNYLFLFGGIDFVEESVFSDLYILNLTTWTWKYVGESGCEIEARNSHSLGILHVPVYKSASAGTAGCSSSSSGSISGSSSSSSASSMTANAASDSTCTLVPYIVVFGGASIEKGPLGDTFYAALPELDNMEELEKEEFHVVWTELDVSNCTAAEAPMAREMHSTSLLFGSTHGSQYGTSSMFIAGGRGSEMFLGDVWELRPTPFAAALPSPELGEKDGGEKVSSEAVIPGAAAAVAATAIAAPTAAANAVNKKLFQWIPREDLDLATGRCAHGGAVLDCGDGNALLSLCGGFTGASIAEDVSCISLGNYDREITSLDADGKNAAAAAASGAVEIDITSSLQLPPAALKWKGTRCGAAVGARFGIAVCTAPKWLLDAKFPESEETNVEDGAMLMYGGVNMERDYADLLLLLPPTV